MVTVASNVRWEPTCLRSVAEGWVIKMRKQKKKSSHKSTWRSYIFSWHRKINSTIEDFIDGCYRFSPMITFRFSVQFITTWEYKDRLILNLLLKIISPVIKHIISPSCYHLNGPTGIKKAIKFVKKEMELKEYSRWRIIRIEG